MHNIRIWNSLAPATNCYVDFIKEFTLSEVVNPLTLQIAVDTEYVVWLNGQFVARGQYRTFPERPVYDTIDLLPFAQSEINRLAITVYYQGEQSYQYAKGDAGLWFTVRYGETVMAASDATVLSAPSKTYQPGAHRITSQYGFGFVYDANRKDEWQQPNVPIPSRFVSSVQCSAAEPVPRPVKKCVISPCLQGELIQHGTFVRSSNSANPAEAVFTDQLTPWELTVPVEKEGNSYYLWDLGREIAGFITFTIDAPAGTVIDLAWGEHINEHGVAVQIGDRNFANRYVATEGIQTFTYYFRRIAGRYLQMHIKGTVNALPQVGLLEESYPLHLPDLPKTRNQLMNQIQVTARETLRQCMHEHYEDCPWREQSMYAGDSTYQILAGYYAFHETEFPRASLDLMGQSMRSNGFLAITAPTDESLQIPIFTFMWIFALANHLHFTKDISLIKQYYPLVSRTLMQCTRQLPDGIAIHPFGRGIWNFYEWSDGSDGGNIFEPEPQLNYHAGHRDGLYQMFLCVALNSATALAQALGLAKEQAHWHHVLATIKQGICAMFWNPDKQRFASFIDQGKQNHYGQLMQSLALYNQIDPTKNHILCDALMHDTQLIPISLGHALFRYEGLLQQGDSYKDFVLCDIMKTWGKMLDTGATTFWETALGAADFGGAGSLCHGWSAIPLYLFQRYYFNITPEDLDL